MKNNKYHGFTLIEIGIVLLIMGFIATISLYSFFGMSPKIERVKFKNANISLKHAIGVLLSSPQYYNDESQLADLSPVYSDKNDGTIPYGGEYSKFRYLLFKELGMLGRDETASKYCYLLDEANTVKLSKFCRIAENGVVWGIPDTDFYKKGVITLPNPTSGTSPYVPVTIYPKAMSSMASTDYLTNSRDYFYSDAIVVGVRADGTIKFVNTVEDCSRKKHKKYAQCLLGQIFAEDKDKE